MIGLVGGIGAGKSRAAEAFARRGAFVIDADAVGHSLLDQRPARERIVRRFGETVIAPSDQGDGDAAHVDRRALATIVFADPAARRDLEAILHPAMRRTFEKAIARVIRKGQNPAVVLDAAVLFEAGWDDLCDLVVFVDAPRPVRLARVAETRGWSAEMLTAREAAQLPLETKRRRADVVLSNGGDPEQLDEAVGAFWSRRIQPPRRETRSGTHD